MEYITAFWSLRPIISIVGYDGFTAPSFFGGNDDHAVGCPGSVNGCSACVFEHLYGGEIIGIDVGDALRGDTVNDEQGCIIAECIDAPDAYLWRFARLSRTDDGDACRLSLQLVSDLAVGLFVHVLY